MFGDYTGVIMFDMTMSVIYDGRKSRNIVIIILISIIIIITINV